MIQMAVDASSANLVTELVVLRTEAKVQIVAESYSGLETVCAVARRHGLASTQLFTWRREARSPAAVSPAIPLFASVVVDRSMTQPVTVERTPARRRGRRTARLLLGACTPPLLRTGRGRPPPIASEVLDRIKALYAIKGREPRPGSRGARRSPPGEKPSARRGPRTLVPRQAGDHQPEDQAGRSHPLRASR